MRNSPYSNVNITAINSAVQLGSGNVVHESFVDLAAELEQLSQDISETDLTEEEKMSFIADVETINSQLAKSEPDKSIIGTAWNAITNSPLASLVQSLSRIAKLIDTVSG